MFQGQTNLKKNQNTLGLVIPSGVGSHQLTFLCPSGDALPYELKPQTITHVTLPRMVMSYCLCLLKWKEADQLVDPADVGGIYPTVQVKALQHWSHFKPLSSGPFGQYVLVPRCESIPVLVLTKPNEPGWVAFRFLS